jgi:hypothetical protein
VQVDPIKPALNGAGTNRLKLKYHKLLSNFPFKFILRRYTEMNEQSSRSHTIVRLAIESRQGPARYCLNPKP